MNATATGAARLLAAAVLFVVLATANAGGYRYGASDQAFYVPAVAMTADPSLFPRDRALFEPQMRLWIGRHVFAALTKATGSLPAVFAAIYAASLVILFGAAVALATGLGATRPTVAAFLALLTLKHQIARTGANSLEGYGHPRVLAFALGVAAVACLVRQRRPAAIAVLAAAAVVHPTTALWFGVLVAVAMLWDHPRRIVGLGVLAVAGAMGMVVALSVFRDRLVIMDDAWLAAIGDREYLFPTRWPAIVWIINLGYAAVIAAVYRYRRTRGAAVDGEAGLIAGLTALVAMFIVALPMTAIRLALAVQLQVNRVFWLLDLVAAFYVAWWLVEATSTWGRRVQWSIVAVLVVASTLRGLYLLSVAPARPAIAFELAASDWTDVMRWLGRQPGRWHVLADPQHVVRYGADVRIAALRDTLLEAGKDPAMAIYDREAAARVLERWHATGAFDGFTTADVTALARRYNLDVFVDRASRRFDFPVLYRNDGFIAYALR